MPNIASPMPKLDRARPQPVPARASRPAFATVLGAALVPVLVSAGLMAAAPAQAERADRSKSIEIDAGTGVKDARRGLTMLSGAVTITQGTLNIQAERVEMRELKDGRNVVTALGTGGKQASFRQKADGKNEFFEGLADRIEYDDRSDTIKLVGNATARRLAQGVIADQLTGATITYDSLNEVFSVEGQGPAGSNLSGGPGGRTRMVIMPRSASDAASSASPNQPAVPAQPAPATKP
jgi:lipopolysaccharide export system protein LptA